MIAMDERWNPDLSPGEGLAGENPDDELCSVLRDSKDDGAGKGLTHRAKIQHDESGSEGEVSERNFLAGEIERVSPRLLRALL
jgi:hypothetical protein